MQSSSHQYTSSQSASRELTTATQQPDAVAAAAAVVDRRRPSSDRELDMLTSTPLVLDPVDVSVLPLVSRSDPVDVFSGA